MGVISSFTRSFDVLKAAPALFVVTFLYGLVNSVSSVAGALGSPLLSSLGTLWSLLVFAFVVPFFVGGAVTLADRGLRGKGSIGEFVSGGIDNYLPLIGFTWVVGILELIWFIFVAVIGYFIVLFLGLAIIFGLVGAGGGDGATLIGGILITLLGVVFVVALYLVGGIPVFLVQFVPGAFVIDDMSPIEGVKRGLRLLADNFLRAFAFDLSILLIWIVFFLVSVVPLAVAGYALGPEAILDESFLEIWTGTGAAQGPPGGDPVASQEPVLTPLGTAITTVTGLLLSTVQFALVVAFYTAFYRDLSPETN